MTTVKNHGTVHHPISRIRLEGVTWWHIHQIADEKKIDVTTNREMSLNLSTRVVDSEWDQLWPILQEVGSMKEKERLFTATARKAARLFINMLVRETT